ncbi:hypothetical protein [Streptomyces sp. NPDC059862]|uniref:hypothetical protein n=1 Tax=unclassified Streptomyces TaxID=2593676 RepID=UPI003632A97F
MIRHAADRKGHDLQYSLDFGEITKLGFSPAVEFAASLQSTVARYRDNPWLVAGRRRLTRAQRPPRPFRSLAGMRPRPDTLRRQLSDLSRYVAFNGGDHG